MKKIIERTGYMERLIRSKDLPQVVKVITGPRRCGKSFLMGQFVRYLESNGVDKDDILSINFESLSGQDITDHRELNSILKEYVTGKRFCYVFLDEVQNVKGWELSVAALCAEGNVDVYITGSNSDMLSTELATHLSGRYIEISLQPLSFSEFVDMHGLDPDESALSEYIRYGSMPETDPGRGEEFCGSYLEGVFNTVLVKDILGRLKTNDVTKLRSIARFLYSNIGNECSILSISKGTGLNKDTVSKYVDALCNALLFYHSEKYDIVGKKLLSTNGKFYASDLGIRNTVLMGAQGNDIGRPLENIVFLELRRRGYTVRTGSFRDTEVDFTAIRNGTTEYFQVTQTMLSEVTREREFRPLKRIGDNFPKKILTLDRIGLGSDQGIETVNLIDWLMAG
ncbi:MAG: ATP-binding protein [archaeon]|nr:ATP-binding protein [archaeon]